MNEKRIDFNESKMTKKSDKQLPASHREYLDMDTDEEESARQETPEPDEELPPDPEKPTFTDNELEILVQYVKNLTVISNVDDITLSEASIDIIREYFRNPSQIILTIFYEEPKYKTLLDFPYCTNLGLTYFLRSQWQIYTVDNFMSTVIYGNVSSNMENSILKFLQNVYSPIAFNSEEWPKVTKDQFFSNFNELLISLTDATYQPMGLAILYIPQDKIQNDQQNLLRNRSSTVPINIKQHCSIHCNNDDDDDDNDNDNAAIERLERVARYWIKQIRGVLCGVNILFKSAYTTIIDEIKFWNYRFESLSCLQYQLSSEFVTKIVRILEEAKSSSVTDFHHLVNKINKMLIKAASNITYLNLLVNYCCEFEIADGIHDYATKILLLIRFIGIESEFYNSIDNIETLCRALGTQIIIQCKKQIQLEDVLENDPSIGKYILEKCINCCENFVEIFNQLAFMDKASKHATLSKINEKKTFCHVNTFIQRCQDLIEVADTRSVFDKCKEMKMIGGTKAIEHELQYEKIQKLFYETLNKIKCNRDCILEVSSSKWLDQMLNFRCEIKNIDNMMNNLIHDIFDDVQNVEEGLEALYSIKRFVIRKHLHKTLYTYWILIWNLFNDELKNIIVSIDIAFTHKVSVPINIPATLLRVKKNYLTRQYNMLIDASDWFDDNTAILIIEKYKRVRTSLIQKENIL